MTDKIAKQIGGREALKFVGIGLLIATTYYDVAFFRGIIKGFGLFTPEVSAFLSGWTAFFQEGFHNLGTSDDPFCDYIFKPFFWISIFGLIPALLTGLWFGKQIKSKEVG